MSPFFYNFKLCALCVCLLVNGVTLFGQASLENAVTIKHFGINEGLPSRIALGSAFDRNHLLWVGTERGLCRLDGYRAIAAPKVKQLFKGSLVAGADSLLYCVPIAYRDSVEILDPQSLTATGARLGRLQDGYFGGAVQLAGKSLYYARGGGVFRFVAGEPTSLAHELAGEVEVSDRLIAASASGYLLYRSDDKVLEQLNAGQLVRYRLPSDLGYTTMHQDRSGGIWVSNVDGLFHKPAGKSAFLLQPPLPSGLTVNLINEDERGKLLFGNLDSDARRVKDLEIYTDGKRSDARWMTEREDRVLSYVGEDFQREFRINSYGGVYLYTIDDKPSGPFRRYLYDPAVRADQFGHVMRGFVADDQGNVYTNKDSSMPYWFRVRASDLKLDSLEILDEDGSSLPQYGCGTNMINYRGDIFGHNCDQKLIEGDKKQFIGYLYRYRPTNESWKRWRVPNDNYVIRWVDFGRTPDELIILTQEKEEQSRALMYYFYPAEGCFELIYPRGPAYSLYGYTKAAVRDTARNCYWIGTDKGFYRYDMESDALTVWDVSGAGATTVSDILLQDDGTLLLSTFQYGLLVFDPKTGEATQVGGVAPASQERPPGDRFLELPTNEIATFRLTEARQILVATFQGLVMHGGANQTTFTYTTREGLNADEFNTSSIYQNPHDKRWYAGGTNGFMSFMAEDLNPPPSPYQAVVTSLRVLNQGLGKEVVEYLPGQVPGQINIPADNLYFGFDFTIPDFSGDGEKSYQTWLEHHDPGWNKPAATASVRYTNLKPGRYVFHLKAYDTRKRKSVSELSFPVIVLKPWYWQWWFILLLGLAVAGLIVWWQRQKLARFRKDMEAERKVQDLELRSLRQQLNPHFISNAMTAIRQYVKREKPEKAAKYLTDFALVMRSFLEASRNAFTPLKEEVNMLERYIGLEQLRFPDKFSYQIDVHPSIDKDMDLVPSLLLQPIIENAINHGLYPLTSGGELKIRFFPDPANEELMICTISDNGVGRKLAAQQEAAKEHISRATEILKDRLEIIAAEDTMRIQLTTEDLHPEREHTGTLVRLVIERG